MATKRLDPFWSRKLHIKKINSFKYKDECGFNMFLGGANRFIMDEFKTPYAKSLLRLLKVKKPLLGYKLLVISSEGSRTFKNENEFSDYLHDIYESEEMIDELLERLKNRENGNI